MIAIVDYGLGNLRSIWNMMRRIGADAVVTSDPVHIQSADKLILPGVGAWDAGVRGLDASGLREVLDRKVLEEQTPVLGICLGMQLLCRRSEEGTLPGLGWIDADVVRFDASLADQGLKVPHMGWNEVDVTRPHPLFHSRADDPAYYFVHSYHARCDDTSDVLGWTTHGTRFPAAIARGNVIGAQFHPEKSHRHGMVLLRGFAAMGTPVLVEHP